MSNTEMRVNKMDLVNDVIGYIMTVGPMLMKPEVSVFMIAMATAGASTTVFKSVAFSDAEEGGYQQEFDSESAAAWNYAWTYNYPLIRSLNIKTGKYKTPTWAWERITSKTSADNSLLMAARNEVESCLQAALTDASEGGRLSWDERWNEDRLARTSETIARDFFVKLYKLIDNNKVLRPHRDHSLMLKRLETIQGSLAKLEEHQENQVENHAELAAEIRELRQTIDMLIRQLISKDGTEDHLSDEVDIDISLLNSVRKLAEGVWINWKTGCLASKLEAAFSGADFGPEAIDLLSAEELRLLSLLSQGEGAIVSWEELDTRRKAGVKIQKIIDGYHNGDEDGNLMGMRYDAATEDDDSADVDDEDTEGDYRGIKKVVEELRSSHPRLKNIIVPEAKGCRILIDAAKASKAVAKDTKGTAVSSEAVSLYDAFYKLHGHSLDEEWNKIQQYRVESGLPKKPCSSKKDVQTWLRLYYNQVCHSFEDDYSNVRGGGDTGANVFGKYKMVQAYINAYATEDEIKAEGYDEKELSHKVEERIENENLQDDHVVMDEIDEADDASDAEEISSKVILDYIERWYWKGENRILVLHGQPGDGKTTFCKKAVYAHCNEGWLKEVPHVLWFSLNPNDNLLTTEDRLNLDYALCLKDNENKYLCNVRSLKNALIILDGYDELDSELKRHQLDNAVGGSGKFYAFCHTAKMYAESAKGFNLHIVITSRTMCIKNELDDILDEGIADAASFAPMAEYQQDALVDRMIELDEAVGRSTEELKAYQVDKLPLLRRKKKLRGLFRIPSLFRMIVTTRFDDAGNAQTFADLFGALFHNLMHYKGTDTEEEGKLIRKYEEIASRIFYYRTDVCPFSSRDGMDDERELLYKFLTKQGNGEGGYLGFLHRSFYQYFLARFIVSGIRDLGEAGISAGIGTEKEIYYRQDAEKVEKKFRQLLIILSAGRLTETFMWSLVIQLVDAAVRRNNDRKMRRERAGKGRNVQGNTDIPMTLISTEHIKMVLMLLDREKAVIKSMADGLDADSLYKRNQEKESGYVVETENAVFNLISACAAAENGCHKAMNEEDDKERWIAYGGNEGFKNVCRLLRRGIFEDIYLEGLKLDGCDLRDASLKGAYLRGASLVGTDLSGAQLTGAHLKKATLPEAVMSAADLTVADMREATLTGAKLKYANLLRARMGGTHLERANFTRACLESTDLRDAVISEDVDSAKVVVAVSAKDDVSDSAREKSDSAKDEVAIFTEANLSKSNLAGAKMCGVSLVAAILTAAHIEGANLSGADMRRAHLEYSNMTDAHLERANFQWAYLDGAYMHRAHMNGAWLDDASLRSAYLVDADLEGSSCDGADFANALVTEEQLAHIHGIEKDRMPDAVKARLAKLKADILRGKKDVIFGHYPQGANNEIIPLRWRVLKVDRFRKEALIITERLIDCKPFNIERIMDKWDESDLRGWLNGEFLHKAFSEEEKGVIAKKIIPNPRNAKWDIEGCEDTSDRVFALSIDEARELFADDEDRMAAVTPYAKKGGSYVFKKIKNYKLRNGEVTGWWWLRSPGVDSYFAARVIHDGVIYEGGGYVGDTRGSVRPALWLNLQSEIFKSI